MTIADDDDDDNDVSESSLIIRINIVLNIIL